MTTYIDTSAIIAILDADDPRHNQAAVAWTHLVQSEAEMVISSYAVVETAAVLQSRYDTAVVRLFLTRMLPLLTVHHVDADLQSTASNMFLTCLSKNGPSLVDCSAFEIINRRGIKDVFAYDKHFKDRGYNLVSTWI